MAKRLLPVLSILLLLGAAQTALAHGYIVRSIPEDRAVLERSPVRLQYWFSEGLEPEFTKLTVYDEAGEVIATGGVNPDNTALLEARLPTNLPDGAYIAELRVAFASDGHVIVETRVFFVGETIAGVEGSSASDAAIPGEIIWRTLLLSSTLLLFGTFTLYSLVLVPAWGNPRYPAGLLPPRLMRRLHWIVGGALVTALIASVLALLQQATVFFNTDVGSVLARQLWNVVRIGSSFGDVWNARLVFLAIAAGFVAVGLVYREKYPEFIRAGWTANIWVLALVLGASTVASHAAGSLLLPWIAMASQWLHALGVGLWTGGLAALVLVLPVALQPYEGETRRIALLTVLRRFSPLAYGSVIVVIATGIYNASNWILTPDLAFSTYGLALGIKLALVGVTVFIGALHHMALRPERYERWQHWTRRIRAFLPSLRLEALLMFVMLASVGLLSATPIPEPEFIGQTLPAPSQSLTVDDLTVTAMISPGGPGVNSYDLVVTRDDSPVENMDVTAQMVNPAADWRSAWRPADYLDDGLYVTTGDDIDSAGEWWLLLNVDEQRFAYAFEISEDAAVVESIAPNLFHVLAMIGVAAAVGYALNPLIRGYARRLDLRPQTVTVAIGAFILTIALLIFGFITLRATLEQTALIENPPPDVVNPVLPDADSLERGAALFAESCEEWAANPDETAELARRLDRMRDEELFAFTGDGWRDLPACDGDLSGAERWNLVNYLRATK